MKNLCLSVLLFAAITGLPAHSQITTMPTLGSPAPTLNGTGAPSANYACNTSFRNVEYYQSDAAVGQRIWMCDGTNWNQNAGVGVYGVYVQQLALTAGLTSQTICAADATCPAGFYHLDIGIEVTTAATVVSTQTTTVSYTNGASVARNTVPTGCSTTSIISVSDYSCGFTFFHAANTTVTVASALNALTGTPVYNFRAQLTRLH